MINVEEVLKVTDQLALDPDKEAKVICATFGHSNIQHHCFGYFYCSRCNEQVGDSLGSVYNADKVVLMDHNCSLCQRNYKLSSIINRLFVENPFRERS